MLQNSDRIPSMRLQLHTPRELSEAPNWYGIHIFTTKEHQFGAHLLALLKHSTIRYPLSPTSKRHVMVDTWVSMPSLPQREPLQLATWPDYPGLRLCEFWSCKIPDNNNPARVKTKRPSNWTNRFPGNTSLM